MPRVLNRHDVGIPEGAVYCGRGSPFGNPFRMRNDSQAERDRVCNLFERHVLPALDVSELRGRDLICYCAPQRCHCDAILRKAND